MEASIEVLRVSSSDGKGDLVDGDTSTIQCVHCRINVVGGFSNDVPFDTVKVNLRGELHSAFQ